MSTSLKPKAEMLFELSWEVCNKVGGIHSVISSKARTIQEYYKNYIAIGPYFKDKVEQEFIEEDAPARYITAFHELKNQGVIPHYGTWLIQGEPKAILLEFKGLTWLKNDLKKEYWDTHKVDSLFSSWDFEEPLLFSTAAAILLKKLEDNNSIKADRTVLQAHEWLSGFAILKLKNMHSKIATVFTTHATMLGRSLAGSGQNLYSILGKFDPEQKARQLGVQEKFTAEKAAAQAADIFTTVSEITGKEAEFILGRKPEVLTLNGFNTEEFPSIEETSIKHVTSRELIREMLTYTFFPYYKFDLKKNLIYYLAGRYEFDNKGMDIFINSLGMLNSTLKKENSDRTVTAFLFLAMPNNGVKVDLLENKNYYTHIKNYVHSKSHELLKRIIDDFLTQADKPEKVFDKEFLQSMKKDILKFKRAGTPPLCTHKLSENEESNSIIRAFRTAGLNNSESDKVKVLLFPAYLDGNDGLLNLEFYDTIAGCHLGAFPSYYEPWGYTPLESGALGVPAITTDVAGFGRFIQPMTNGLKNDEKGIYILSREEKNKQEATKELYNMLLDFSRLSHEKRVDNKIQAIELSHLADWKILIKHYIEAHNLAIEK